MYVQKYVSPKGVAGQISTDRAPPGRQRRPSGLPVSLPATPASEGRLAARAGLHERDRTLCSSLGPGLRARRLVPGSPAPRHARGHSRRRAGSSCVTMTQSVYLARVTRGPCGDSQFAAITESATVSIVGEHVFR